MMYYRDRISPNHESQHASQGLLVTHKEVQLAQSFPVLPDVIEPALRLRIVRGPAGIKMPYHRINI